MPVQEKVVKTIPRCVVAVSVTVMEMEMPALEKVVKTIPRCVVAVSVTVMEMGMPVQEKVVKTIPRCVVAVSVMDDSKMEMVTMPCTGKSCKDDSKMCSGSKCDGDGDGDDACVQDGKL